MKTRRTKREGGGRILNRAHPSLMRLPNHDKKVALDSLTVIERAGEGNDGLVLSD